MGPSTLGPSNLGLSVLSYGLLVVLMAVGLPTQAFCAGSEIEPVPTESIRSDFKILLESDGVYAVSFEQLAQASLGLPELSSAELGMDHLGKPVPIWVDDGGDGRFGPGDHLEFVGQHLPGPASWSNPHSRFNVYWLRSRHPSPKRMTPLEAAGKAVPGSELIRQRHFEKDLLLLRFPPRPDKAEDELWYWTKLVHNQKHPFRVALHFPDLARGSQRKVELRVQLRGWSYQRKRSWRKGADPQHRSPALPDHRVEILLGDEILATSEWDGRSPHLVEIADLDPARFGGSNALGLRVPRRQGSDGEDIIDVVTLDWLEVTYPRLRLLKGEQTHFRLVEPEGRSLRVRASLPDTDAEEDPTAERDPAAGRGLVHIYGEAGSRTALRLEPGSNAPIALRPRPGEQRFFAASESRLASPNAIVADRPSQLRSSASQTDYLIVTHGDFRDAIEPLAAMHRRRGLSVTVIDIDDIYDEFGHGIPGPRPLQAFVSHAYHSWPRPAPRFLLLVGDASWDARNPETRDANYADGPYRPGEQSGFIKIESTPYPEDSTLNHRLRIPTWTHHSGHGHSASDNFFATVDGDDHLPDLAVGRFPVVTKEEVRAIVAKTRSYLEEPEVGPWRREILLITNEEARLQKRSDVLAAEAGSQGWAWHKVYPQPDEKNNEQHSERLLGIFDRGQLMVHFLGHGGRYIWRTGPPDFEKNHDLFTLDHLDQLEPHGRLPVVLSLTCFSAPFDHPSADSIGEKLLRLDQRGAVAVLAASWRNNPMQKWSQTLFEELTRPGATVGEAIRQAKVRVVSRPFVKTYNLLGDPALPIALPAHRLVTEAQLLDGAATPTVEIRAKAQERPFSGRALVEVLDAGGEVLIGREILFTEGRLETRLELPANLGQSSLSVRTYAWNSAQRIDAMGSTPLELPSLAAGQDPGPGMLPTTAH